MRPRREVSPVALGLLRPFFRRCWTRNAWILRLGGNRWGPVLVLKGRMPSVEDLPERFEDASRRRGRFARTRQSPGEVREQSRS